jgi:hypothetical protein
MTPKRPVTIQLLFVDTGEYRAEEVRTTSDVLERYDRLIDFLQEEPEFLKEHYVDLDRLCSARVLTE